MPETATDDTSPENGTGGAPEGQKPASDSLLTLKQIAEDLSVSYSRLRGFADATGMREAVGAVDQPGVKGVRYPQAAKEKFAYLIAAQDDGLVNPTTAAAYLTKAQMVPQFSTDPNAASTQYSNGAAPDTNAFTPGVNALMRQFSNGDVPAPMAGMFAAMQQLATAIQAQAPLDTWYTLAGASRATGLSQRTIKANVPFVLDGTRKKYSAADLRAYQARVQRFAPMLASPPHADTGEESPST